MADDNRKLPIGFRDRKSNYTIIVGFFYFWGSV